MRPLISAFLDGEIRHFPQGRAIMEGYMARLDSLRIEALPELNRNEKPEDIREYLHYSDLMVVDLDGGASLDPVVSARAGYYAGLGIGPIFAKRTDMRLGENMACSVNPQILGNVWASGGDVFENDDDWFVEIAHWANTLDSSYKPAYERGLPEKSPVCSSGPVRFYVANQIGFSSEKKELILEPYLEPLRETGIEPLDPFEACSAELDLEMIQSDAFYEDRLNDWFEFNRRVAPVNNELMSNSNFMLAVLHGGCVIDDGVANEIGYYCAKGHGPVYAFNANPHLPIPAEIRDFVFESGGSLFNGEAGRDALYARVRDTFLTE